MEEMERHIFDTEGTLNEKDGGGGGVRGGRKIVNKKGGAGGVGGAAGSMSVQRVSLLCKNMGLIICFLCAG